MQVLKSRDMIKSKKQLENCCYLRPYYYLWIDKRKDTPLFIGDKGNNNVICLTLRQFKQLHKDMGRILQCK